MNDKASMLLARLTLEALHTIVTDNTIHEIDAMLRVLRLVDKYKAAFEGEKEVEKTVSRLVSLNVYELGGKFVVTILGGSRDECKQKLVQAYLGDDIAFWADAYDAYMNEGHTVIWGRPIS